METSSKRRIQNVVENLLKLAETKRQECDAEYEKHIAWLRKAFQENTARFLNGNKNANQAKKYKSMRPSVLNKINKKDSTKLNEPAAPVEAATRKRKSDQAKYETRDLRSGLMVNKPVDSPNPNPKKKERFRGPHSHKKKGGGSTRSLETQIAECMKLTVKILRIQLKKAGLSTSGRKAVLAERLAQYKLEREAPAPSPEENDLLETKQEKEPVSVKEPEKTEENVVDPMEEDTEVETKPTNATRPDDVGKDPMEVDLPIRGVVLKEPTPMDESKSPTAAVPLPPKPKLQSRIDPKSPVSSEKGTPLVNEGPLGEKCAEGESTKATNPEASVAANSDAMDSQEPRSARSPPVVAESQATQKQISKPNVESTNAVAVMNESKTNSLEELRRKNEMKLRALREAKQAAEHVKPNPVVAAPTKVAATPPPPLPPKPPALKSLTKKPNSPGTDKTEATNDTERQTSNKEEASEETVKVPVTAPVKQVAEENQSDKLRREMEKRLDRERHKSTTEQASTNPPEDNSRSGTSILGNIVKGLATFTEESRFIKETTKPKKPVKPISALEKAKLAKEEQEKREEQRRKQREAHRQRMAENKRRKAMEAKQGISKPAVTKPPARPALPKPKPVDEPWDPEDNYEISDKGESSSSDDQDSERETERSKKYIPKWARSKEFKEALRKQYDGPTRIDPDKIFGEIQHCDLEAIFKPRDQKKKKKYKVRGSSAMWTRDGLTIKETKEYKKAMGLA